MNTMTGTLVTVPRMDQSALSSLKLLATTLILGTAFFAAGHDWNISLADDYTEDAEQMEISAAGGNTLRRFAFIGLAGWGIVLAAVSKQPLCIETPLAASLTLLLGLAAISFVWADDPGMCRRRLLVLACCVVAALGIGRALDLRQLCWLTLLTLGGLALLGVAAELRLGTFRPWAGDYRFAGTVHPNTQGPSLAALGLAALGLAPQSGRRRPWLWGVLAASIVLLLLTKSRATAAAIAMSIAAVQLVQLPLRSKLTLALGGAWLACVGLWLLYACGLNPLTDFRNALLLGRAEESDTLTGRAVIWPEVLYYVQQQPWLGYGYESFWTAARIDAISGNLGWGLREAHNAYLELLLWLGIVGLMLAFVAVAAAVAATIRGYRCSHDTAYMLPLGLIVFGLINAGLESGMVVMTLVPFLLLCCVARLALFSDVIATNKPCS
jgi:exopolysaccharide production protein ExoQ